MMVGLGGQRGRWFVVEVVVVGGFERKNKRDWREEERSPFHLGIFKTIYIENGLTS